MKLYIEKFGNKILKIETENILENGIEVSVNNIDDLYEKLKEFGELDDEITEKISQIFEENQSNQSLNKYNIKHWVSNRSFGELIDMYENNEINKPDMQREFVWDSLRCSRLIESILLGLPIPPLFLLEVGNSQYELVDGYQRLTTLVNFVKGYPWSGKNNKKKALSAAKLSKKVSKEIAGKSFKQLSIEHQRIIRRSTIPLIEFKQLEPDNYNSKYLVFERINTGSEKLNPMQIRKSLAHGKFMDDLYRYADKNEKFIKLFTMRNIKKDVHVEAFLRIYVMKKIYNNSFEIKESGIINILNQYCEEHREENISQDYFDKFEKAIEVLYKVFTNEKNICRRVEKNRDNALEYMGNLNIAILEAMLGLIIEKYDLIKNFTKIEERYKVIMNNIIQKSIDGTGTNPFSVSTGTKQAIISRFEICNRILVEENADL